MNKVLKLERSKTTVLRFATGSKQVTRSAALKPTTWDAETRTFEFLLTDPYPCENFVWVGGERVMVHEVLAAGGMRNAGSLAGLPILDSHMDFHTRCVIGAIVEDWQEGDATICRGTLSASDDPDILRIAADIEKGILNSFSIGAWAFGEPEVLLREGQPPLLTYRDWECFEASLVPRPANPNAKIRSAVGALPANQRNIGADKMDVEILKRSVAETVGTAVATAVANAVATAIDAAVAADEAAATPAAPGVPAVVERAAPTPAGATKVTRSAEDQSDVALLRARVLKRAPAMVEDFDLMAKTGASLDALSSVLGAALTTSQVEVDVKQRSAGTETPTSVRELKFENTTAGKKAAARK